MSVKEYLRRNLIHAKAVGAEAGAKVALKRVCGWTNPPKWLVAQLERIIERAEPVAHEVAVYRDQIKLDHES